jgi:hypothetical protein
VWWYKSVIPALGRLRQEDHEFKDSLGFILSSRKPRLQGVSKKQKQK